MRERDPQGADHFQVPLMLAFREAFEEGDAAKRIEERVGGERVVSGRGSLRRRGADEALLKRDLAVDLLSLVNTIDLGVGGRHFGPRLCQRSIAELRPARSFAPDQPGGRRRRHRPAISRTALLSHEPRLRPESIQIEQATTRWTTRHIASASRCRPRWHAIRSTCRLEFVAEVDVGSGKVRLTRLPIST